MVQTAVVTGAAGFLGRHLVERLIAEGWQVTAFCRIGDRTEVLPAGVRIAMGNLLDPGSLDAACAETQSSVVFHLAGNTTTWARHREQQLTDNVDGTRNVIAAAERAGARRLVYTSSISAYGWQPGVRLDEQSPSNVETKGDGYGRSKYAAEQLVKAASRDGRLSAVILNPVNVVGRYDATNWARQLIVPIATGKLRVVPPGSATWICVDDVIEAHLAAVDAPVEGANVILGGAEASFLQVVQDIAELLGRPKPTRPTRASVLRAAFVAAQVKAVVTRGEPELTLAKYRRATGNLLVDDSLAQHLLGLRRTPLLDMLADTIDWLHDVHLLPAPPAGVDATSHLSNGAATSWVPVSEEPHHHEQFANPLVRVYEARIPPGTTTLDHRHDHDTVYLIVRGGRFRSDTTFRQRTATRTGRSSSTWRTIGWLLRRLTTGWLQMPDGTVLWQPHSRLPLVHRVTAAASNPEPVTMTGIELHCDRPPRRWPEHDGLRLEWASPHSTTYRVSAHHPDAPAIKLPADAVLTIVHGEAIAPNGSRLGAGDTGWVQSAGELTPRQIPLLATITLV